MCSSLEKIRSSFACNSFVLQCILVLVNCRKKRSRIRIWGTGWFPCLFSRPSYELCAGLLDRPNRTKEQAVCDEIREELGYVVKPEDLEFVGRSIFSTVTQALAPGAVGMSGARMYMYYVEVTPDQKQFQGGGLKEEGEQISEYRVPLSEMDAFLADYDQEKSASIMMGMYWWRHLRGKNYPVGKQTKCDVC